MIGRRHERGIALIAVLFIMVMLLGVGAAIHSAVMSETGLRGAHARTTAGFYAAEAGVNRGMNEFRRVFAAFRTPGAPEFVERSFPLGPRTVYYQLSPVATNQVVRVPAGQSYGGLLAVRNSYTALSRSELTAGDAEARLGSQFDVDTIPLFQFLAFYQPDLEILPGPNMNLHGPIHTNGNLYLNADSTFTIDDCYPPTCPTAIPTVQVSAVGDVIRGRKDAVSCSGTVQIAKLEDGNGDGDLDLRTMPCGGTQTPAMLAGWLGAIKSHEPVVSPPAPGAMAVGSGSFWLGADLRIALDLNNPMGLGLYPIVVLKSDGTADNPKSARLNTFMALKPGRIFYNDVPRAGKDQDLACVDPNSYCNPLSYNPPFLPTSVLYPCPGSDLGLYTACTLGPVNDPVGGGQVTARRAGFWNSRERAWVYMLNVNVHDLLAWNRAQPPNLRFFDPNDTTDGGPVLFLTVRGPSSTGPLPAHRYGVRVFGSPNLDFPAGNPDPTGLTVVSDQAIYVEGDYNVGNAAFPKQPAALIGDTINVISNGWSGAGACKNDCQSRKPLASRVAATSAIYGAFLGGVDTTTLGNYNGGLENYPRFHETWSGRTLFYRGSFVAFGAPTRNNGPWCGTGGGCNIYDPPGRNWDFDPDFMTAEMLPPMTPRVVTVKQVIFAQDFR